MNPVRKRILKEVADFSYKDLEKYRDLIAFFICDGYFSYNPDTDEDEETDFNEVIVVVERDWLFDLIKREEELKTDDEVQNFLRGEYTSDDSSTWYEEAILANKIVMVDFN